MSQPFHVISTLEVFFVMVKIITSLVICAGVGVAIVTIYSYTHTHIRAHGNYTYKLTVIR